MHSDGTLSVQAATEKDAGDYLCITRNRVADDYRLLRVSVASKPAKIEPRQPLNHLVLLGKTLKVGSDICAPFSNNDVCTSKISQYFFYPFDKRFKLPLSSPCLICFAAIIRACPILSLYVLSKVLEASSYVIFISKCASFPGKENKDLALQS